MNCNWAQPRKIFHLDNLPPLPSSTMNQDLFTSKWTVIEGTILSLLLQDGPMPSIVLMTRALQSLLVRNYYSQLHSSIVKTFYKIYKEVLGVVEKEGNSLLSLLAYYISKKAQYRIVFEVMNNYLGNYTSEEQTMEEEAYKILCHEIVNSAIAHKICQELMDIVNQFRSTKQHSELLYIEYQLGIIDILGIYRYFDGQFLQKSKRYIVSTAHTMAKNQQCFNMIDQAIRRETSLNKILKPSENTVRYIQKEYIQEYFPFLIQFMDYLVQQNKIEKLKMLWKFTNRLGQQERQMLQVRLRDIVRDVTVYLKVGSDMSKILLFKDKITHIITYCFDNQRAMHNILFNTLEEVFTQEEKRYNQALSDKILQHHLPGSQQTVQYLFKLTPNKEKFIRELEVRFFKWILYKDVPSLLFQDNVVQIMKKECGTFLCRKLERMMMDVWKDGSLLLHSNTTATFKCRMFSSKDWPKFKYSNIMLPDAMLEVQTGFEAEFSRSPQNGCKELQWVNELGQLELSVNGTCSLFSQPQAAILFILDKSFRPMKEQQLVEVLQAESRLIEESLANLLKGNILQYNQMNQTYDINDNNIVPYCSLRKQRTNVERATINENKDNSIIIQAAVVRILKRKKSVPKTQVSNQIMSLLIQAKPNMQQINMALQKLQHRQFIEIDKNKGILHYRE